jgi:hypothetical protein
VVLSLIILLFQMLIDNQQVCDMMMNHIHCRRPPALRTVRSGRGGFRCNHDRINAMTNTMKSVLVATLIAALVCLPFATPEPAYGQEPGQPSVGSTWIDALIYRPVGLVAIPVGAVLFVLTVPFAALGGNVGQAWNGLVVVPVKYTFARPLGDI